MKVLRSGAVALMGVGLAVAPAVTPRAAAVTVDSTTTAKINILHFNDFHGRIDGTAAKLATAVETSRAAEGAANTLLLSGGDNVSASLYVSSSQKDNPTIDALNALGVQASAVGNHEFDYGITDLQDRLRTRAKFPYLAANVTLNGTGIDKGYEVITIDGMRVGVIGAVTQETPGLTSPAGMKGVVFTDPVDAVNRVATQLTDGNDTNGEADVLVAEYHEGYSATGDDLTVATGKSAVFKKIVESTSPKVSAIFNAHTHQTYDYLAPIPGSTKTRPVIQAANYGSKLGNVILTVDRATKAVTVADHKVTDISKLTADKTNATVAAVAKIEADAKAQAAIIGGKVVGSITNDVTRAYTATGSEDRGNYSPMGSMIATMYRDAAKAEIGITNPGGLRTDLVMPPTGAEASGQVTVSELAAVQPFANNLWIGVVSGTVMKEILNQQFQTNADGTVPSRPYLALGITDNVTYTIDPTKPAGQRIQNLMFKGQPWTDAATHTIAAPIFLMSGGDNFRAFTKATSLKDTAIVDIDGFQTWMPTTSPYAPDFAVREMEVTNLPTSVVAGKTLAFDVAKIDTGAKNKVANKTLEVYNGTTKLGTATVTDGVAKVSLTVPVTTTPGVKTLRLFAPDTKSQVFVTMTVTAPVITKGTVKISDTTPEIGVPVTAVTAGFTPGVTFTYQWSRNGYPIAGATGASYTPTMYDLGKRLSVRVTASMPGAAKVVQGSDETVGVITTDKLAPSTGITITYLPGSAVVTLNSRDLPLYQTNTGVKVINYRFDGKGAVITTTSNPVTVVLGKGTHYVTFWAVDRAGNVEAKRTINPIVVK